MLFDRRAFCQSFGAGFASGPSREYWFVDQRQQPADIVLYDRRYLYSQAFAELLSRTGILKIPLFATSIGTSPLVGRMLLRGVIRGVAGLTTYADFVIARSIGREIGLRSVFEETFDTRRPILQTDLASSQSTQKGHASTGLFGAAHPSPRGHPSFLICWLLQRRRPSEFA
jgi:hypothetical protein